MRRSRQLAQNLKWPGLQLTALVNRQNILAATLDPSTFGFVLSRLRCSRNILLLLLGFTAVVFNIS